MSDQPTQEHPERRFRRLMPRSHDLTLIILKGHLLIEEQLLAIIVASMPSSSALGDARFTFHQVLCLARAFSSLSDHLGPWKFLSDLNALRNKLVHRAEVPDLVGHVDKFIIRHTTTDYDPASDGKCRARLLKDMIANRCGMLYAASITPLTFPERNMRRPPNGNTVHLR